MLQGIDIRIGVFNFKHKIPHILFYTCIFITVTYIIIT